MQNLSFSKLIFQSVQGLTLFKSGLYDFRSSHRKSEEASAAFFPRRIIMLLLVITNCSILFRPSLGYNVNSGPREVL